jgi:signal transduction histidine kinase
LAEVRRLSDPALAALLTVAGVAEVIAAADDGSRAVSALALAAMTVPLAWRRTLPLLPVAAIAVAFIVQELLGGFLVGEVVTPLVALAIALYSAGRHLESRRGLVAAALGVVVVTATRVVVDPTAQSPEQAGLTLVAVSLPLLVGRWVRGQSRLQRELVQTAARLERDRERAARDAAEEERMRIVGDLQATIAGGLREIVQRARALQPGDPAVARAELATITATARDALADVRRVLGILRRDGERRLEPPALPVPRVPSPGPAPSGPEESAVRLAPATVDRLLAGGVLAGLALELAFAAGPLAALTAIPIAAPLLWRRRVPLLVVVAVLAAVSLQSLLLDLENIPVFDIAAIVAATYALAAHAREVAVAGLAVAALGAGVHAAIFYPHGVVAALLGGVVAPWTIGLVVRSHRQLTDREREEAVRAERARAQEARAAVTAERMRVARELHDAVAHNLSVIAIQAGGAGGIVERDPARTAEIAALIETVAREALAELERLAGALDATHPGLARVDALTARARDAGLPVELRVEGDPPALPAGVDVAAYRIVQEALANAAKHAGPATASVVIRYDRRAVEVEVADDGRGGARRRRGGGHGLIGMRERVALYGGTLEAGRRASGGFRVHARLPIG